MKVPDISIVFGTLNRVDFLQRALASIPRACGRDAENRITYEIIVVDGGSTDGTLDFLRTRRDKHLTVIAQGERRGAVAAFNEGFRAARGEFVAGFNDDAEYVGMPLVYAVAMLRSDKNVGQVAIPFVRHVAATVEDIRGFDAATAQPQVQIVSLPKVGLVPYANFGVIARALGDTLGWWGDCYYQYAGDTELSTQVWAAGLHVASLEAAHGYLIHYEAQDETRLPNVEAPVFNARWRRNDALFRRAKAVPARGSDADAPVSATGAMRYLGKRHGSMTYRRPGSPNAYVISAAHPEFVAAAEDVAWLLSLKERGRRLFARKTGNG